MQPLGSVAAVAAAVREDAAAEAERLQREADAEMARLGAVEEGPALAAGEREALVAAAHRAAREKLAAEDAADAQAIMRAREAWMAEVARRAVGRSGETVAARGERLRGLVAAARARLPAGELVVTLAPADLALVDGAVADPTLSPGGVRIATRDGRLSVDESLEARAARFETAWRAALGRIWG